MALSWGGYWSKIFFLSYVSPGKKKNLIRLMMWVPRCHSCFCIVQSFCYGDDKVHSCLETTFMEERLVLAAFRILRAAWLCETQRKTVVPELVRHLSVQVNCFLVLLPSNNKNVFHLAKCFFDWLGPNTALHCMSPPTRWVTSICCLCTILS